MYTTCAFCAGSLGGDGGASGLGVGKRFAFDSWKSRAWVICAACARWNLTPFDTRVDAIAALEDMAVLVAENRQRQLGVQLRFDRAPVHVEERRGRRRGTGQGQRDH